MKTFWNLLALGITTTCFGQQKFDANSPEAKEAMGMITEYQLAKQPSLAYRIAVWQQMLAEANYFARQLDLPTSHPIQISDAKYPVVFGAWFSLIKEKEKPHWPVTSFTNHIFDASIPREQRVRALQVGISGVLETTNFFFSFSEGKLWDVQRLSEHGGEYYSKNIEDLVGKPSLVDSNGAYQLATQWLSAVDIDVKALERKYPPEVNRLRLQPQNSTNVVEVPFYFVHWGWSYFTNGDDRHTVSSTPLVQVKLLGTTKELVELRLEQDTPDFSRRPLLLVTNLVELLHATNPPAKSLQPPPER